MILSTGTIGNNVTKALEKMLKIRNYIHIIIFLYKTIRYRYYKIYC